MVRVDGGQRKNLARAASLMSEATVDGTRAIARPRLAWIGTAEALVAAIVAVSIVLHVVWLVRFRHGYVTEWDESGYIQFALSNYDALREQGPWTSRRPSQGAAGTARFFPWSRRSGIPSSAAGIFESLLVLPVFFAGLVGVTFALARQFVANSWAVFAALVVAAMPAVVDYTRLFHFALPATACMTAALWALVRTDRTATSGLGRGFRGVRRAHATRADHDSGVHTRVRSRRGDSVPRRGNGAASQDAQSRSGCRRGCARSGTLVHPKRPERVRQPGGCRIRERVCAVRRRLPARLVGLLDEGAPH